MNHLSHYHCARIAWPDAPAAFFVGNVLPDLAAGGGDGKLSAAHVAASTPAGVDAALVSGIRLHLATDRRFHSRPQFAAETARAGDVLRSMPLAVPVRRRFFVAHVFVEIALDGLLLQEDAGLAADFYAKFAECDLGRVAADTGLLLGLGAPALGVGRVLHRFAESRYLCAYASPSGMATALRRAVRPAGLHDLFAEPSDQTALASAFGAFLPELARNAPDLLSAPDRTAWYNSGEFPRSV
jgi:hypothetical protein